MKRRFSVSIRSINHGVGEGFEKSDTVGAFDKAGNVDTICILLGMLIRLRKSCIVRTKTHQHLYLNIHKVDDYMQLNLEIFHDYYSPI